MLSAGNGSDAAMQRAMAASLRDIQEHEERVRKQAQQAQRETMGPNGESVQPQGGTLACVPQFQTLNTCNQVYVFRLSMSRGSCLARLRHGGMRGLPIKE